jgi:hypothetical protein
MKLDYASARSTPPCSRRALFLLAFTLGVAVMGNLFTVAGALASFSKASGRSWRPIMSDPGMMLILCGLATAVVGLPAGVVATWMARRSWRHLILGVVAAGLTLTPLPMLSCILYAIAWFRGVGFGD